MSEASGIIKIFEKIEGPLILKGPFNLSSQRSILFGKGKSIVIPKTPILLAILCGMFSALPAYANGIISNNSVNVSVSGSITQIARDGTHNSIQIGSILGGGSISNHSISVSVDGDIHVETNSRTGNTQLNIGSINTTNGR